MSGEDWCPFPNGEIGNCHERRPHHHYNPRPGAAWEIVYTDGVEPTTDRSTAPDAEFAAVLERIEAAPEAEEGLRAAALVAVHDMAADWYCPFDAAGRLPGLHRRCRSCRRPRPARGAAAHRGGGSHGTGAGDAPADFPGGDCTRSGRLLPRVRDGLALPDPPRPGW